MFQGAEIVSAVNEWLGQSFSKARASDHCTVPTTKDGHFLTSVLLDVGSVVVDIFMVLNVKFGGRGLKAPPPIAMMMFWSDGFPCWICDGESLILLLNFKDGFVEVVGVFKAICCSIKRSVLPQLGFEKPGTSGFAFQGRRMAGWPPSWEESTFGVGGRKRQQRARQDRHRQW